MWSSTSIMFPISRSTMYEASNVLRFCLCRLNRLKTRSLSRNGILVNRKEKGGYISAIELDNGTDCRMALQQHNQRQQQQRQPQQQRELEQLGCCVGADSGVGIHAMKCASVSSSIYSRVHCAVATAFKGEKSESSSSNSIRRHPFVWPAVVVVTTETRRAGPAGLSGLSAARQRVPWPLP